MQNRASVAFLFVSAAALSGCLRGKPTTETFSWKGPVKSEGWLRLRNISGDFDIKQGPSDSAEIQFVIERSNGFAPSAQVKVLQEADGVIACVLYGDQNNCSSGDYRGGNSENYKAPSFMRGRTSVHGTVLVPRGVKLDAESTNGDISVSSVASLMQIMTVNGDIEVRGATQSVTINTTNGDIDLGMDAVGSGLTVQTTNGSVNVDLPASLNAALKLTTTNGALDLGLAANVTSKSARQIIATLGSGGSPIDITTTNGDVSLRQHGKR
jgi:Putative adhesin